MPQMQHYTLYFAQAYGEGAYGTGTYSCSREEADAGVCVAGSSGAGSGGGGSGLADTGIGIAVFITLACLIVFISLVVRIWRRPKPALQEAQVYNAAPEQQAAPSKTDDL